MSSIIQTISYTSEEAKPLMEKFGEHIGIHNLTFVLTGGDVIEGIISEVGKDFITVIEGERDTIIPISNIQYFQYSR